ncbi:MAG: HAD hydrolase-like protein, partial [Lachnospiraceae bacterium]
LLQYYNFEKYTDIIHGGDYENKLTKKDIIKKCLVELQITNCSKAVMVGDSAYDAKGAMQVGVLFAGVTYGFDFKDLKDIQLYTNIGGASTPMELLRLLI